MNLETGTTTQDETIYEVVESLKEATALYLEEFPLPTMGYSFVTMFTLPEPLRA